MKHSILILISIVVFYGCTPKEETKPKPNVVLIVADDLGWTDLGSYNSAFYETPNIDKLTNDGVKFTNGYATCPVCSPSRVSLQTGKYPVKSGITDWIKGRASYVEPSVRDRLLSATNDYDLDLDEITLAEVLKSEGYKTFFAGKWHLGEEAQFWPENQGYDINIGGWKRGAPVKTINDSCNGYFEPYCNPRLEADSAGEYLPRRLSRETAGFIEQNHDAPFFVCLSTYLVHTPLQSREELIRKYMEKRQALGLDTVKEITTERPWMKHASKHQSGYEERLLQGHAIYAAMMESLDNSVGEVIDKLKAKGIYDNTLIVFTSDNGGLSTSEGSPTTNDPLRGGKGWLYEGGIRVPFIVKLPGEELKGQVSEMPVTGNDIFPTIHSLVNAKADLPENIDGLDLLPFMQNDEHPQRPLFWHYPHYSNQGGNPGSVVRMGKYKLIHDFETGARELYDLSEDIGETNNIAAGNRQIVDSLWTVLEDWRTKHNVEMMELNPAWNGEEPVIN